MKLYIDTSDSLETKVGLDGKIYKLKNKDHKSQRLLSFIDEVLKKEKKTIKDVKEIDINLGPGSFTGLRVGLSVANALSWALDIPLNGERKLLSPKYDQF